MSRPKIGRIQFIEAAVALLPREAGGRHGAIHPRTGTYTPWVRLEGGAGADQLPVRFIEGPAAVHPGESALVVLEILRKPIDDDIAAGTEFQIHDGDLLVGIGRVVQCWS